MYRRVLVVAIDQLHIAALQNKMTDGWYNEEFN